ncbi:hypothetical protein GGI12_000598 [Dipsacomyces acuminosporus]|nr:hypothetical protein GGI12_000598 [Dipsacomyces acuminosporus]
MCSISSRDPEWKREFAGHLNKELGPTDQRLLPMMLATVDLNGHPAVRTVSLQGFVGDGFLRISQDDDGQWTSDVLTFSTHAKSNKVQELIRTSDVQLAFWLPHAQAQVRCSGQAHLLFHPDNPNYTSLSLDIRHRIWPRDDAPAAKNEERKDSSDVDLDNVTIEIDEEFIREQAYLHLSPAIQAWYSWPAPGKIRSTDPSLYPAEISSVEDPVAREKHEADARRNYVLVFVDIDKVDIVDLNSNTRRLHKRRSDTTWTAVNVNL